MSAQATHRQRSIILDGIDWLWRLLMRLRRHKRALSKLALEAGTPVASLVDAIDDFNFITHSGGLESFRGRLAPLNPELYAVFKRALHAKCLVRNSMARLLCDDRPPVRQTERGLILGAVAQAWTATE
jgi:hypothetical protein